MLSERTAVVRLGLLLLGTWLALFSVTRLVLLVQFFSVASITMRDVLQVLALGLAYDVSFLLYAALPLLLLLWLPERLWRRRAMFTALQGALLLSVFVMLFVAAAEWLFWDEFGVRFNFIAVDYLVYSDEVLNNILESYPVYPLLAAQGLLAVTITAVLNRWLRRAWQSPLATLPQRALLSVGLITAVFAVVLGVGQDFPRPAQGNAYLRELGSNGPYQFFAAFRNNELDYPSFYATLPQRQVAPLLQAEWQESNARLVDDGVLPVRRQISNQPLAKPRNVVLVTIESLSAKYLGSMGDTRGLTPNLDQLRTQSVFFNQFYATGTRTDRGLEAITLSVPPTPGRSIVKRLGRESGFASLGQQLTAQGYDSVFVYGGRGYFDNMNTFFAGNGYRVVDQSSVPDADMSFTNAWGMADEDLYRQAMQIADQDYATGKPFFLQLMTTSNHRPYTYPAGRIDIASGEGREGAVKYTDYAIGAFLKTARTKPWFNDTLFVFVADHTAGSAGIEDLPVANYHIPLFIYAPGWLAPREVDRLTSQIDLAPTLLGLLGMSYTSTFFGVDALRADAPPGRALIGNYQHLGLFDGRDLAILSPQRLTRRHDDALGFSHERATDNSDPLLRRDIAYYQGASYAYRQHLLSWQAGASWQQAHARR
ncbi:LTA synthase family protein [Atopomonas hussainii]|uniref:LTA synthase family protein n=1 Tax=Atopomonas hussainii TaxID=1429083 RepID=UPI0008FFF310|nr:LTA synthase family protein [Atopomonas hussainii]